MIPSPAERTMPMPTELRQVLERYCRLGAMLTTVDSFDTDDSLAVAEVTMTLREMAKVQKQIAELATKHAGP